MKVIDADCQISDCFTAIEIRRLDLECRRFLVHLLILLDLGIEDNGKPQKLDASRLIQISECSELKVWVIYSENEPNYAVVLL